MSVERRIRVLIVDDSVVACKALSDVLATDPGIELAGMAHSGASALAKLPQCVPDVVILDVDMPEMDGLQTLAGIRKGHPRLPVIMCSGLTEAGSATTVKALLGGASDYVTKPRGARAQGSFANFQKEVLDKIHTLCPYGNLPHPAAPVPAEPAIVASTAVAAPRARIDVVAIAVSTGGPKALAEVIPNLPSDFPAPILIVQHMPPDFTKSLAESLGKRSALSIEEGRAGAAVVPGKVYLAPGGQHMVVVRYGARYELALHDDPPVLSCRPSANLLFQSAAAAYGASVLGVVMTGMGQDGADGAAAIRKAGGMIFVQDEASSVVWGMPGAVVKAGLQHRVIPLKSLAGVIHGAVLQSRGRNREASGGD
ncbi:MAG: chemotaxis response regulator protein-glutamate methylesterase [Fibrobacteres bacterium]|nr:chemotaxis response regulator protein-glutamate methylesterase [Fibrobacterota bacterium]